MDARRRTAVVAIPAALILVGWSMPGIGGEPAGGGAPQALRQAEPSSSSAPAPSSSAIAGPEVANRTQSDAVRAAQRAMALQKRAATLALPKRSGAGKRIVYSVTRQRVWLVNATGAVARTYRVSGQPSQPDAGSYRVYSKSRNASSAVSTATMRYMVRFTHGKATGAAIGFHDIPRRADGTYEQTIAQLGQPLSAGCIRQRPSDAKALWDFAPVGTRVVVTR